MAAPSQALLARAVFLGAPGAGKGTQAKQAATAARLAHISTGDMLRSEVAAGSALGQKAKGFMDAGKLVPDEVIIGMVQQRIQQPDAKSAWILDGFPRTLPQAEALDKSLSAASAVTHVIYFAVPEQVLFGRLTGRRTCSKCGAIWHTETVGRPSGEDHQASRRVSRADGSAVGVLQEPQVAA
jgi:adenylate kinase